VNKGAEFSAMKKEGRLEEFREAICRSGQKGRKFERKRLSGGSAIRLSLKDHRDGEEGERGSSVKREQKRIRKGGGGRADF